MAPGERGLDRAWVRQALSGPMTSIHPLFTEDGSLDPAGVARHIDHALAAGSGTMLLTYGDSLHSILSDREVGDLLRMVIRATAGRAMVVAADRQWPTRIELEFARGRPQAAVFDDRGNVVGMVASTDSVYYEQENGQQKNLQMVFKNCVSARSILALIEPKPANTAPKTASTEPKAEK